MKKIYLFIFTVIFALLFTDTLPAMSIGREGAPYSKNDITWQKVCYKNDNAGFTASIPGEPTSGLSGGNVFSNSEYQNVYYEIHCSLNEHYSPPKTKKKFIQEIEKAFAGEAKVVSISSNQAKVKYIAELYFNNGNKIVRIYCSSNSLYWAIVEGKDLSIAPLFFNTVEITK